MKYETKHTFKDNKVIMSFNNASEDLEASGADAKSIHYKDFPEFETYSQQIESNLSHINNSQIVSVKSLLNEYDSLLNSGNAEPNLSTKLNKVSNDISEIVEKITQNYKLVNDLTKNINDYLKTCELNHEDNDTISYLRQKEFLLIKLIKSSLRQFQTHQKRYESLQQKTISEFGGPTNDSSESQQQYEEQGQLQTQLPADQSQSQQQQQVEISYEPINAEELEQQTLLIQEREREIEQISQDISYINEIYGNLEDIVHEQQFTIDSIEDNILRYSDDAHGASNELRRAERYQRRTGGRMLCCLFILLGLLAFIILIGVVF